MEIDTNELASAIRRRAHNSAIRAMLDGHAELILTLEEADELGDEAAAWCRARGLAWTEFDDGVRVGAKKSAVRR